MRMLRPALLALFVAACAESPEPAPVVYRTPVSPSPTARPEQPSRVAPAAAPAPAPSGQADSRGVVSYNGYETIRAHSGDSVESMAARVGLGASELAAYNGLSTQYQPREGDELVLPARPDRYQGPARVAAATPAPAPAWPEYSPSAPVAPGASEAAAPGSGWSAERAREALRETPPEGGVSAAPLPAPEEPSQTGVALAQPSAPAPAAAPAPPTATPQPPSEPQSAAAPAPAATFSRPVDAPVSRGFSRAPGPDRNDGVDFATVAGDEVRAAAEGEVALISQSLGGLGTIVLIRHDNEFLTVYGRIDRVTVQRGDRVARGQVIARVADLPPPQGPSLHFEVRRGAESVDPAPWL